MKIALGILLATIVLGLGLVMVPWTTVIGTIQNELSELLVMSVCLVLFALFLGAGLSSILWIWRRYD